MTTAPAPPQPNDSTPLSPSSSTSVFNALGSYADRIRDKEMKDGTASASSSKKSPKPSAATDLPNGSTSHPAPASASGSSTAKTAKSGGMPPPAAKAAPAAKPKGVKAEDKEVEPVKEDEGAWETVPAGKSRRKEKESTASTNWRDRPRESKEKRESSAWRNGGEDERAKGESRRKGTQGSSGAGVSTSSTTRSTSTHPTPTAFIPSATPAPATRSASVTPATTTRKAWGIVTPSPSTSANPSSNTSDPLPGQSATTTPANPKPAPTQTPKSVPARTTTPPSPSGTATAVNTSVTGSVASPNLSATAETASTATMVTPRGDDEDWRMRPRKLSAEMVENDLPGAAASRLEKDGKDKVLVPEVKEQPRQVAAPPPATNAWAERKKAMGTANKLILSPPSLPAFPAVTSSESIASKSTITPSFSATMAGKTALPGKPTGTLFGSVEINESKGLPNGHTEGQSSGSGEPGVKIGATRKKKQGQAAMVPGPRHVVDTNAFPDLAQAAKAKKDAGRAEKDKAEGSVAEETAASARKTKWTAIPAAELLAAADEARRQAQAAATRQKQQQSASQSRPPPSSSTGAAESSLSPTSKTPRKKSVETRKGRAARSGSGSELRLPPNPSLRRGSGSTAGGSGAAGSEGAGSGFKHVFGSINGGAEVEGQASQQDKAGLPTGLGVSSEPISRHSTDTSRLSSPLRPRTQLPSPTSTDHHALPSITDMPGMRFGSGPLSANGNGNVTGNGGATGSSTTPIPQGGFTSGGIPRASKGPRRPSFSGGGRGRGNFRGGYRSSMGGPGMGMGESPYLPNGLSRNGGGAGNGGFSTFVPQSQQHGTSGNYDGGSQGMYAVWDPVQGYAMPSMFGTPGGANGRQGLPMPPPPMPVTQAAGLDALRFYVLGQVEYYFSMQNLAMDFFLRQQMDSEGWIDIAMITSFNRIKSLTPDLSIIKEVMLLSSILEVRDDKVRLSHGESKRWILPDAKPSPFVDDGSSTPSRNGEDGEIGDMSLIGYGSIPIANGESDAVMGLGLEGREVLSKGVENALMRPRDPITGLLSTPSVTTMTETGTDAGTDAGDVESDVGTQGEGLGLMKDGRRSEDTKGTSLSSMASEEAEKVELR